MADRAWAFVPDPDGKHRSGIRIECADCQAEAFYAPNSGGKFPPNAAAVHFSRAGWTVGKGPRRDFCPKCTAKRREKQKESNVVQLPKPLQATPKPAPREMSREDRKLIIAEVKGCWDEQKERYMDGWHDERVAQSLGAHVPVAWVREVREDFFGDSGSNPQFDEFMAKAELASVRMETIAKQQSEVSENVAALRKMLDGLNALAKEVRRAVGK